MTDDPKPEIPPELRAAIMEVGNLAILAGCTADEFIALCKGKAAQFGYGVRHRSETGGAPPKT